MAYDDSGRPNQTYGNSGPGTVLNEIHFVGVILGFCLILNRLYWRWKKGTPGIDDIIIVLAWLCLLTLGIVTFMAVDYGYGRNSKTLTRGEASDTIRMFYLYQIFYKLSLNLSKLSILTLYLRVFDTKDWFGKVTKALIFLIISYAISILAANIFICTPTSTYWDTSTSNNASRQRTQCINILGYWYASSLYNIISETLMLVSVLVRIWTLPSHSQPPILQFRQKINLTVVLGLGVFTVITAILRVTTLDQAAQQADRTGGTLVSTIWSSVEACLGLAVANLPMVRQLLRWRGWCGGRWFSSTAGKSRHEHSRRRSEHTSAGHPSQRESSGSDHHRRQDHLHSLASPREIHRQRDFRCEVITRDDTSSDIASDIEAQGLDVNESRHQPPQSPGKSMKSIAYSSREVRSSGSKSPSIASTIVRSPTEPMPMVRISTEPSTSSLQSVFMQPMVQAHVKERGGHHD